MNQLKVNQQDTIIALHRQGWSKRKIARELGVDRSAVRRYLASADSKPPTNLQTGSAPLPEPKPPTNPRTGILHGPESLCERWKEQIQTALQAGLSVQRIYQDLTATGQFGGSYDSVWRFVRKLEGVCPLPFRHMEVEPGAELQVDFGQGAWVVDEAGKRRRPHLFRAVLSHSRKGYSEAVWRQTTETFLRCLENAFRHFGGVPRTVIIDDMGLKALPKHSGEYLFEVIMRRYENRSTIMTSNRPLEEWGKLLNDVPTAGAILDRFLHHAQVIAITGRSYRVKDVAIPEGKKGRKTKDALDSPPAKKHIGDGQKTEPEGGQQ